MKIVQFAGKFYHDNCFDAFLQKEKSTNKISNDYMPNLQIVEPENVEDSDSCEECSGVFSKETSMADTSDRDADDDKGDDPVTNTPSPPQRRRR